MNEKIKCPYCTTEELWTEVIEICNTWCQIQEIDENMNLVWQRSEILYQCKLCKMCFAN